MAASDENGQKGKFTQPFSLRFEPNAAVANLIPKSYKGAMSYVDQLASVPANSALYNVYAMSGPKQTGGKEFNIGTLVLDGLLTNSKWGDEKLFFRHQRGDDDLKANPQWKPYFPKYSLGGKCPF